MLGATTWLTLATLAGLAAGFGREWLLLHDWGVGSRTDAFLVAMFLPEAARMMMASGLLNAAALPLYQSRPAEQRQAWLGAQFWHLAVVGVLLGCGLDLAAPLLARAIGPGQSAADLVRASHSLRILAWCLPGICLQALLVVPYQAHSRFLLAGMGSLLYNLPAVILLAWQRHAVDEVPLAWAFVAGSVLMMIVLLPLPCHLGWRPWHRVALRVPIRELHGRLAPLLLSAGASQGLAWLERICASYLGAGTISIVNFARKLNNLPLVALMSLNQVLLGLMGRAEQAAERRAVLARGLQLTSLLTVPAAVGMILIAPVLVHWLLPASIDPARTAGLLAWMAVTLVIGGWNAMLARYAYAHHDTTTPTRCELAGSLLNAIGLLLLPRWLGVNAIAVAALLGVMLTGSLLARRLQLGRGLQLARQWLVAAAVLGVVGWLGYAPGLIGPTAWIKAVAAGSLCLAGYALWLRPWRPPAPI
ncbi:murein biosynthesis integral membrane protein MurJ [Frateuria aurantia]